MDLLRKCALRLTTNHFRGRKDIVVICDRPHIELADAIKEAYSTYAKGAECLVADDKTALDHAFNYCRTYDVETLVLIEPGTFAKYQVSEELNFSSGLPKVAGLASFSYVSILPIASTFRVYGSNPVSDAEAVQKLLASLNADSNYKITTDKGTRLSFTARHWLDQGNEVLTAPVEGSINGVIAVDGALFFQKLDTVLDYFLEAGELVGIRARDRKDDDLVQLYRRMTEHDFSVPKNRQLAEVGFGCNTGAAISDCFMESELVYGTAHFCFGNNACYGGKNTSNFHGGSVLINRPRIIKQ